MKLYIYIVITSCFICAMTAQQNQNTNDLFEGNVTVGPLNPVLKPVTIKNDQDTKPTNSQVFALDFNILNNENQVLTEGTLVPVTITKENKRGILDIKHENSSFTIQYALPNSIEFTANYALENAQLRYTNLSGPEGANKSVEIVDQDLLDTAFFWGTKMTPFAYETKNNLRIIQQQVSTSSIESGYIPAPLLIIANGKEIPLTTGKPTTFSHQGKEYTAYVLESTYLIDPNNGGCANGGYIIRCIIGKSFVQQ